MMRPIPVEEHPSQLGDQPDALDEIVDEESDSSAAELTTTDEDEECIELCPHCEESIYYNTFFEPTSRSREQLRSGYAPSAHSCRRLNERADAAEEQAAQLYDETKRLESTLKELRHRRRLLVRFSKEQRALASPIRRLPFELLLEIFRHACIDSNLLFPVHVRGLTAASLSCICHRWRRILLENSILWTFQIVLDDRVYFYQDWHDLTSRDVQRFGQVLKLYLDHLGSHTYALKLCGPWRTRVDDVICDFDLGREVDILPAFIFRNLSRCRSIEAPDTAIRYLGAYAPSDMIMEHLEDVIVLYNDEDTGHAGVHPLFRHAPRLKFWKQQEEDYCATPAALSQLVHLEMKWMNAARVHTIISHCLRLQYCNVSLYTLSDTVDPATYGSSFTLPHLETLQVSVNPSRTTLERLFSALSAPRLKHARFFYAPDDRTDDDLLMENGPHWPQQAFDALLQRSKCRLMSLELLGISLSQPEVGRLRVVLPMSGSELRFEPEPPEPNTKFSSGSSSVRPLPSRFRFRFGHRWICSNLFEPEPPPRAFKP
ncbi:uncharacterized protein SCHCODRAFT_02617600 [Schizophyllum commune H4-8]|nr:uncharacterized protein SCHCODRAFT_02617600 [Schizophyllum commune H4-8]KAI5894696.1 hypothetical protein SCHCODRAFT_02617600 [Schizophyllum commune H4-8]